MIYGRFNNERGHTVVGQMEQFTDATGFWAEWCLSRLDSSVRLVGPEANLEKGTVATIMPANRAGATEAVGTSRHKHLRRSVS